jgi:Lrp/AsnC family leucine-responsive transcriptional regulator
MTERHLDETDLKILELLQSDARTTNTAIAQSVGLSAPSVLERIRKLEAKGVIKGYRAIIDGAALGRPITAFIRVSSEGSPGAYPDFVKNMEVVSREPEVLECHSVAGEDCFIIKVKVASPPDLESLLGHLRTTARIGRTVSMIVLSTMKEETILPLETTPAKRARR